VAHSIIVDEKLRQSGTSGSLEDVLEKQQRWAEGYDPAKATIRRNQRNMRRFEQRAQQTAPEAPVRGRRTGKAPPPGARGG
jgi:hypothetical protein